MVNCNGSDGRDGRYNPPPDCLYGAPPFTVTDNATATKYSFLYNQAYAPGGNSAHAMMYPSTIQDRNGNITRFSATDGPPQLPVIDTLGRTMVSATTDPNNGYAFTNVTVGGLSYGLSYGTTSANFTANGERVDTSPGAGCVLSPQLNESSYQVVSSLNLPNGQQYSFTYDPQFGMINQITYPGGASVQYTWGVSTDEEAVSTSNGNAGPCIVRYHTLVITDRFVSNGISSSPVLKQHFTYQTAWADAHGPYWSSKTTTVSTTDMLTGQQTQTVYTYAPAFGPNQVINAPGGYQAQVAVEPVSSTTILLPCFRRRTKFG